MKLKCGGIITILLAMLFETNGLTSNNNEYDIKKVIEPTSVGLATYIKNNFDLFIDKYNEQERDTKLNASYIEFEKEIYNITNDYYAYYLDFDGENGYALFGNDYSLLSFSTNEDLSYLRSNDNVVFSETEGFLFVTENGDYGRFDFEYKDELINEAYNNYPGTIDRGGNFAGGIYDADQYIKGRFGDGYYCYNTKKLSNFSNVKQNDYALGEGNCTLSAMFGVMRYFRNQKGKTKISLNTEYYNGRTNPKAYNEIRKAFEKYGYKDSSDFWCSLNMANAFNSAMNSFGYSNSWWNSFAYMNLIWSFTGNCKNNIDAGYPSLWNCARGFYGSHSTVVIGYKQYRKDCGWWIFRWHEYKDLMIINDNWYSQDMYFDLDSYGWNLWSEGFGTFLTIRDYAF